MGGRITTGTPFRPQNVYRDGVPVRFGTTTPLKTTNPILPWIAIAYSETLSQRPSAGELPIHIQNREQAFQK